jgi:hypothetical protein
MSSYVSLQSFGATDSLSSVDNPLSTCSIPPLESRFLNGSNYPITNDSTNCQLFTAGYCANNWDGTCEYMSKNTDTTFPAMMESESGTGVLKGSTPTNIPLGEILIKQTAMNKYITHMSSNCQRVYQPFNPTVVDSPLVSRWVPKNGGVCTPIYDVVAETIDADPVMNKILAKPIIALDILVNIYNTRTRNGTLKQLKGTRIGDLFNTNWFQSL